MNILAIILFCTGGGVHIYAAGAPDLRNPAARLADALIAFGLGALVVYLT